MLRQSILILIAGLTMQASAGAFDYLPASQGSAKEFKNLMEFGNFKQALMTWGSSHGDSAYARSANGQATFAYLLYQNGIPLSALEILFSTRPSNLHPKLLKIWTTEIKSSVFVQKGWVQTRGGWKNIHNNEHIALKIRSRKQIIAAFAKADRLPKDNVNQKARIWWQIATQAPLINEIDYSLRALKLMRESGQTVIGQDQVSSTQGRVLYQKGELGPSLEAFNEIPKSSSLWVEAAEERAWNALRADDYDKALGQSITLISPALAPLVGPESYYLANLMALKVCDYPRIFKQSELFKTRHSTRLNALQEISKTGTNKNLHAVFDRFDQKGVAPEVAGPLVEWIPRATFRDQKFLRYMEIRRAALSEQKKSADLLSVSLGSMNGLENVQARARVQSEKLKQLAFSRVRTLAENEIKEYRQILNKMHIVEGEVIQRLAMDDTLKGERSKLAKVEDDGDKLVFPYSSDEVWFDELDNYKARVKDCPTLKGASL